MGIAKIVYLLFSALYFSCMLLDSSEATCGNSIPAPTKTSCGVDVLKDPYPWIKMGRKAYLFYMASKSNWFEALHHCRSMDSDLLAVESTGEMSAINNHLISILHSTDTWFWTGANDLASNRKFTWMGNGRPVWYMNWARGQPDNGAANQRGPEHCASLFSTHGSDYLMDDFRCVEEGFFICERRCVC